MQKNLFFDCTERRTVLSALSLILLLIVSAVSDLLVFVLLSICCFITHNMPHTFFGLMKRQCSRKAHLFEYP
jgi:hypothetical protein